MRAQAKWVGQAAFMVQADSGHGMIVDGSAEIGGRNLGPRPMELLLQALATCSAMDVIHMLRKAREAVEDLVIDVEADRADAVPAVFTRIHLRYTVTGRGLRPRMVERAVTLSQEKYCSVSQMLAGAVAISHSFTVIDTLAPEGAPA